MRIFFCKLIVFLIFISPHLQGQTTPFSYQYFSYQKGLPDRTIIDLFQDSMGFVWVSTSSGLSRFDGFRIRNFSNAQVPHLAQKINISGVGKINQDDQDNLIIRVAGVSDSLEILNLKTLNSYGISFKRNKNLKGQNKDIFSVKMGKTYLLNRLNEKLIIYQWEKNDQFKLVKELESGNCDNNTFDKLIVSNSGDFYVFDNCLNQINHFSQSTDYQPFTTYTNHNFSNSQKGDNSKLDIFHLGKNGEIWFSGESDKRIYSLEKPYEKKNILKISEAFPEMNMVWEDQKGTLIFGSFNQNYCLKLISVDTEKSISVLDKIKEKESKITSIHGHDFSESFYYG